MTSTLDRVAEEVADLKADAAADYRALVESLAGGEEVFTAEMVETHTAAGGKVEEVTTSLDVLLAIEAAGKTLDDLKADVRLLVRRRDLAAVLAGQAEAEEDRATAQRVVDTLIADRDAAVAAINLKINVAAVEVEQATARVREAKAARAELTATADPVIRQRITALNAKREPAVAEVARHKAEVDRLATIAARPLPSERDEARNPYPQDIAGERRRKDDREEMREAVETRRRAEGDLVLARGRFEAADARLKELLVEIAREQASMLVP